MMEIALKQRLVGASVIIALAVIFIPMIFDNTNRNKNQSISIEIPGEPADLKHKVISIDSIVQDNTDENNNKEEINNNQIQKQETIIDVVDNSVNLTQSSSVVENNVKLKPEDTQAKIDAAVKEKIEPEVNNNTLKTGTTSSTGNSYRVKLGSFSEQKNAQQLKARVIHHSYQAIVEKDTNSGLYKVYSKQFDSLPAAESVRKKIQKLNLNIGKPSIETLNQQAVEDTEILLNTGWIVQIGIFSSKSNSIKLRDKIRNKGYVTFVDEILNSKQQIRYRVRVGPFATRDEAAAIKIDIKKTMNLKGLLKPHEKHKVVTK